VSDPDYPYTTVMCTCSFTSVEEIRIDVFSCKGSCDWDRSIPPASAEFLRSIYIYPTSDFDPLETVTTTHHFHDYETGEYDGDHEDWKCSLGDSGPLGMLVLGPDSVVLSLSGMTLQALSQQVPAEVLAALVNRLLPGEIERTDLYFTVVLFPKTFVCLLSEQFRA
jgi:hypothetical protein